MGNAGLDNVFVDAEDAVEAVDIFLNVVGDGGRRVRDVKSDAPPGVSYRKLFCFVTDEAIISSLVYQNGAPLRGQCYNTFYVRKLQLFVIS